MTALSTGVEAGITIGAVLGVALLIGVVVFCLLRRKKARHPDVPEMSEQTSGFKKLLQGRWRVELDGKFQSVEIDSRKVYVVPGPPAELEAPQYHREESPVNP